MPSQLPPGPAPSPAGSPEVLVRPARRTDRRAVVGLLTDALVDDPAWGHVVPDREQRQRALHVVLGVAAADSGHHSRVAAVDGQVLGAALWQPPGRYPMTALRKARAVPRMLPLARLGRARARELQRFGDAVDGLVPAEVRYLQALGVAPQAQGRRLGSLLVDEGLVRADSAHEEVYLETGKEANVGWYQERGFRLVGEGPLWDGGPHLWRLSRAVREPAERAPR